MLGCNLHWLVNQTKSISPQLPIGQVCHLPALPTVYDHCAFHGSTLHGENENTVYAYQ